MSSYIALFDFLEKCLSLNLELAVYWLDWWLVSLSDTPISPHLPQQHWEYRCRSMPWLFMWVLETQIQFLMPVQKTLLPTEQYLQTTTICSYYQNLPKYLILDNSQSDLIYYLHKGPKSTFQNSHHQMTFVLMPKELYLLKKN